MTYESGLFHDCGISTANVLDFISTFDFLAKSERVTCRDADKLMAAGIIFSSILVEPLTFQTRSLVNPVASEDINCRHAAIPLAIAPTNLQLIEWLGFNGG